MQTPSQSLLRITRHCFIHWSKYKLIGFTSTITVSVDYTVPIGTVYIPPRGEGACSYLEVVWVLPREGQRRCPERGSIPEGVATVRNWKFQPSAGIPNVTLGGSQSAFLDQTMTPSPDGSHQTNVNNHEPDCPPYAEKLSELRSYRNIPRKETHESTSRSPSNGGPLSKRT